MKKQSILVAVTAAIAFMFASCEQPSSSSSSSGSNSSQSQVTPAKPTAADVYAEIANVLRYIDSGNTEYLTVDEQDNNKYTLKLPSDIDGVKVTYDYTDISDFTFTSATEKDNAKIEFTNDFTEFSKKVVEIENGVKITVADYGIENVVLKIYVYADGSLNDAESKYEEYVVTQAKDKIEDAVKDVLGNSLEVAETTDNFTLPPSVTVDFQTINLSWALKGNVEFLSLDENGDVSVTQRPASDSDVTFTATGTYKIDDDISKDVTVSVKAES